MFHKTNSRVIDESRKLYENIMFDDAVTTIDTCDHTILDAMHGTIEELEDDGYSYNYDLIGRKFKGAFTGKLACLHPGYFCAIEIGGMMFYSAEHAYQAYKCKYAEDAKKFAAGGEFGSESGFKVRQIGRKFYVRDDWSEEMAEAVMRTINRAKLDQNDDIMRRLKGTRGIDLCYANLYGDSRWGVAVIEKDGKIIRKDGRNLLGKILNEIRDEEPYEIDPHDFGYGKTLCWNDLVKRKFLDVNDPEHDEESEDYSGCSYYERTVEDEVLNKF